MYENGWGAKISLERFPNLSFEMLLIEHLTPDVMLLDARYRLEQVLY